jgi:outer membrane murein-binding lipoprotein Lpp
MAEVEFDNRELARLARLIESSRDSLTTKVDGLTTKVDGLTTKVDGLTTKVDGLMIDMEISKAKAANSFKNFDEELEPVPNNLGHVPAPPLRLKIGNLLVGGAEAIPGGKGQNKWNKDASRTALAHYGIDVGEVSEGEGETPKSRGRRVRLAHVLGVRSEQLNLCSTMINSGRI